MYRMNRAFDSSRRFLLYNKPTMNKSTPLSQLPSQAAPQQPEPKASDILGEDDATIQEVLNQINMQHQPQQNVPAPPQISVPQVMQPPQPMPPVAMPQGMSQMMQQAPSQLPQDLYASMMQQQPLVQVPSGSGNTIDMFFNLFMDDIKLALMVFSFFIIANFIPISSILNKYIAIEKIPYHDVILRAIFCAVLIVAAKKLLA